MKRSIPVFFTVLLAALTIGACSNIYTDKGSGEDDNQRPGDETITYVAVTGIAGVPDEAVTNAPLDLSVAIVEPANASNKTIRWELVSGDVTIDSAKLTANVAGKATIRATIINGRGLGSSFTQDFEITATDPPPGTHTVSFYPTGGAFPGNEDPLYVYVNNDNSTPVARPADDPVKDHYTFINWFTSQTGGTLWDFSNPITGPTSLYAQWDAAAYTITYNLNGGTNSPGNPVSYTVESASITLQVATKTGYTFGGWFADDQFTGSAITEIPAGSSGDKDFYAKWTPVSYSITYNLNGGTNSGSNPPAYTIESAAITLEDPMRSGANFEGWFADSGFSGNAITEIPAGSMGNKTFYAKWDATVYSITYYLNGGTDPGTNPTSYTTETENITLQVATKTHYTFGGWFADGGFSGIAITEIPKGSSGDKDFYAKWTPVSYSITYNLNGGVNSGSNPTSYTVETENIILQDATKTSATFDGWFADGGFTGGVITQIPKGSSGAKAFFAKWTAVVQTPNPGDQKTDTVAGVQIPFRYVPPTAGIGSSGFLRDSGKYAIITYGYWMAETEVTQELYQAVFPDATFNSSGANKPAESMTFYQAIAFCNKLSALAGKTPAYTVSGVGNWAALAYGSIPKNSNVDWNNATLNPAADGYRLPAQMEWLWAAMGATKGSHGLFPVIDYGYKKRYAGSDEGTGVTKARNYAWYSGGSTSTNEVKTKLPNELDIYDMSGNVAEYVWGGASNAPSTATVTDFLPTNISSSANPYYLGRGYSEAINYLYSPDSATNKFNGVKGYVGIRILCPQE